MSLPLSHYLINLPLPLEFLLKTSLVLLFAWLLHFTIRRANPRLRMLLWRLAVCVLLLLPIAIMFTPPLKVTQIPMETGMVVPFPSMEMSASSSVIIPQENIPPVSESFEQSLTAEPQHSTWNWPLLIGTAYVVAVCFILIKMLNGLHLIRRVVRSSVPPGPREADILLQTAHSIGWT